LLTIIFYWR